MQRAIVAILLCLCLVSAGWSQGQPGHYTFKHYKQVARMNLANPLEPGAIPQPDQAAAEAVGSTLIDGLVTHNASMLTSALAPSFSWPAGLDVNKYIKMMTFQTNFNSAKIVWVDEQKCSVQIDFTLNHHPDGYNYAPTATAVFSLYRAANGSPYQVVLADQNLPAVWNNWAK